MIFTYVISLVLTVYDIHANIYHHICLSVYFLFSVWCSARWRLHFLKSLSLLQSLPQTLPYKTHRLRCPEIQNSGGVLQHRLGRNRSHITPIKARGHFYSGTSQASAINRVSGIAENVCNKVGPNVFFCRSRLSFSVLHQILRADWQIMLTAVLYVAPVAKLTNSKCVVQYKYFMRYDFVEDCYYGSSPW